MLAGRFAGNVVYRREDSQEADMDEPCSDATLLVLDLGNLSLPANSSSSVFKGVSAICLDAATGTAIGRISFARRRSICNAEVTAQGLVITKEVNLTVENVITTLKRQAESLCFADGEGYKILDMDSLRVMQLFPLDRGIGIPLVAPVDEARFLLATGGSKVDAIGLFLAPSGDPANRATLQWPAYPKAIGGELRSFGRHALQKSLTPSPTSQSFPAPIRFGTSAKDGNPSKQRQRRRFCSADLSFI